MEKTQGFVIYSLNLWEVWVTLCEASELAPAKEGPKVIMLFHIQQTEETRAEKQRAREREG